VGARRESYFFLILAIPQFTFSFLVLSGRRGPTVNASLFFPRFFFPVVHLSACRSSFYLYIFRVADISGSKLSPRRTSFPCFFPFFPFLLPKPSSFLPVKTRPFPSQFCWFSFPALARHDGRCYLGPPPAAHPCSFLYSFPDFRLSSKVVRLLRGDSPLSFAVYLLLSHPCVFSLCAPPRFFSNSPSTGTQKLSLSFQFSVLSPAPSSPGDGGCEPTFSILSVLSSLMRDRPTFFGIFLSFPPSLPSFFRRGGRATP